MKKISKTLVLLFILASSTVYAQQRPMHEVYSMMVYNFIKYVQWPDHSQPGEFVIGVVGNDDLYETLSSWYGGKARGTKTYVIKRFKSASDVTNCHVVFVDKAKSNEFDAIRGKTRGHETLVITDKPGLGQKGSGINFRNVDNKLRFELNQRAIESANLKVAGALTSMAIVI